ncbi:GGDEF domain-containing protein [Occallatibacter riparius]|uniref:diguanylate cyclase n=1 Tax=Occallatibacter riparius TaxID=1002689 RepID=A0A9J7BN11_9BACT|nr:GGDEF domain-containing protein [Occallatibacter riparius]UWZ83146.1 GGDEF domain-containing protein [Occallatibacter riparius]
MISIRKYLDGPEAVAVTPAPETRNRRSTLEVAAVYLDAYRSALTDFGRCSVDVCASTGAPLENSLVRTSDGLASSRSADLVAASAAQVRACLKEWSHNTARHFQQKAAEVKQILLAMAQTTAAVTQRDQRCTDQLTSITTSLQRITSLDDISAMRRAIEHNAANLKASIDRMQVEGRAVLDQMQAKVAAFETKLQEAEDFAACDPLTHLRNRLYLEDQLAQRISAGSRFCVAILDIDGFKSVNDTHGHVLGDELLKHFAAELRSACRSSDIVGRWGGDEFLVLLDCGIDNAQAQIDRAVKWACGNYTVQGTEGPVKLTVGASVGLAEFAAPESMKELLDRADAAMYQNKRAGRPPTKIA